MQCDTFDDIPDNLCNPLWINEQIFGPLSSYVGPVFSGLASNAFTSTDVEWGRSLQLSETETLQLRIYPRGVVSNGRLVDTKSNVVLVAARRKSSVAKDYVTFAILWHSEQEIDHGFSAFDTIKNCSQTVAARNLHIVLPSLFNHHDATFGGAPEGAKPNPAWPILDEFNFEAVKPSSFSVHRPHKMPSGETLMSMTAAPGVSQFVIGGHFAGIDTDNCHYRSAEPLPYNKWQEIVQKYTTKMQTQVGFDKGLKAMHNAMTLADMLTCEGILGILGHSFANGALPDMMHSPGGFPLLIAFATRLACYPQRFGLTVGTHTDQLANRELISLFESNWEPISPMKAGDRNVYAIDLALRRAHDEAREHARKNDTKLAVTDNTTFWHRAGQRCVTAVFGPTVYDFIPPLTSFQEPPSKLMDPLLEARVRVIQKQMKMAEAVTGNEGRMSMQLATTDQKRNILLMVLNSVEHWLRTGTYCGMQIHRKNTVGVHIKRPGGKKPISKKDLREQLHSGIEDSVRDMMASGEYDDEDKARAAAKVLSDGIEAAMMGVPDDETIDFNDLDMDFPWKFVNQHDAIANGESSRGSQQPFTDAAELDHDNICIDAFHGAISCISASMCQDTGSSSDCSVLSPMDMPPPPVLPKRSPKGMFSSFYMLVHGRSVYVPHGAVVRNHGSPPLKALRDRIPHPRDVIVLAARDTEGDTQYGWFVRYETEANRLIRMPYTTVEALWAYVHKIPELQECSLNTNYVDAYFSSDTLDFETIAIMRFDQLKKTLTAHSSKKRQRDTDNQSVPASPSRVAVLGQCTICLEEDVDLHVPTCCGTGGATCADCHAKMRNLCPVCERAKVNANYQCQACNSVVRLKDYGHPCATCSACVLCDGCYADYGECANCDPVRGA